MSLTTADLHAAADLLDAARRHRAPIAPLTASYPALSVDNAYAIQKINLERQLHRGHTVVGHKIGLTSEPMQTLLGVDEPDFGYVLDDMVIPDGGAVAADLDLPGARAALRLNATEIGTGLGAAVLGDPAAAVAWLANALAPYDIEIAAGQFVMSGSFTSAAFIHRGDRADATITGLGSVSLYLD